MNWACDAYNRTATIVNPCTRSPHEMNCKQSPRLNPIYFLEPGFFKLKRTNKMDSKARECFYLVHTGNHPKDSKHVLVRTGTVMILKHVALTNVLRLRPSTAKCTSPVKWRPETAEGTERQARSVEVLSRRCESEPSGEGVEMVTSEADDTERENTPLISGRAASTISSAGSSVHSRVFCDPKGRVPSGEGPADVLATSYSVSYGPDQKFTALRAGEAKILAEHIPKP